MATAETVSSNSVLSGETPDLKGTDTKEEVEEKAGDAVPKPEEVRQEEEESVEVVAPNDEEVEVAAKETEEEEVEEEEDEVVILSEDEAVEELVEEENGGSDESATMEIGTPEVEAEKEEEAPANTAE